MTEPKTAVSDAPPSDDDEETVAPVPATSLRGDEENDIEIAFRRACSSSSSRWSPLVLAQPVAVPKKRQPK